MTGRSDRRTPAEYFTECLGISSRRKKRNSYIHCHSISLELNYNFINDHREHTVCSRYATLGLQIGFPRFFIAARRRAIRRSLGCDRFIECHFFSIGKDTPGIFRIPCVRARARAKLRILARSHARPRTEGSPTLNATRYQLNAIKRSPSAGS